MARNENHEWLTVADIATRMRLSKMTIYRLIHSGELPAINIGNSFRIHAPVFEQYLADLANPTR